MTFIDKLGGRKFVLSFVTLAALVLMAVLAPASLTTQAITAILGVVAVFSGSNTVLSALYPQQQPSIAAAPLASTLAPPNLPQAQVHEELATAAELEIGQPEASTDFLYIDSKLKEHEAALQQIIDILKGLSTQKVPANAPVQNNVAIASNALYNESNNQRGVQFNATPNPWSQT